uniref:Fungal lipase-type domain-containing protein n=1 Tax=viral metagenome TaxID=1070528 RepID=A0A6C0CM45_9ZZZZ
MSLNNVVKDIFWDCALTSELAFNSIDELVGLWNNRNTSNEIKVEFKEASRELFQKLVQKPQFINVDDDESDELVRVCILEFKDKYIVGFRGTETKLDLKSDIDIRKVPITYNNKTLVYKRRNREHKLKMHCGFYRQYLRIKEYLDVILESFDKSKKVIFTGFSLGGALATIASFYYRLKYPISVLGDYTPMWCVTYGSPRVGNKWFSKFYNVSVDAHIYRIILYGDSITRMPSFSRFKHIGTKIVLCKSGIKFKHSERHTIFKRLCICQNPFKFHSLHLYIKRLDKLL